MKIVIVTNKEIEAEVLNSLPKVEASLQVLKDVLNITNIEWNQQSCANLNLFPHILQANVRQDMSMHA